MTAVSLIENKGLISKVDKNGRRVPKGCGNVLEGVDTDDRRVPS